MHVIGQHLLLILGRLFIIALGIVALLYFPILLLFPDTDDAIETLSWNSLAPPWEGPVNPMDKLAGSLNQTQQRDLYTIFWGPHYGKQNGNLNSDEQKARDNLKASGVDPDAFFATMNRLRKKSEIRDQTLVHTWDGQEIKISGYVLPLEFAGTLVTSFLLVPDVGACIHVPPPPPNQMIHITTTKGFKSSGLYTPVWVTGRLSSGKADHTLSLVDGASKVTAGYSLQASSIIPYKE